MIRELWEHKWLAATTVLLFTVLVALVLDDTLPAQILGGYATVLLVLVNLVLLSQNQELIKESRRAREQEQERYRDRRAKELDTLRQSLISEIASAENLSKYAGTYSAGSSIVSDLFPRAVYEQNAEKLGRLTSEERDLVIKYYSKAKLIESSIEAQRRQDYPADKDAVTEYFQTIYNILDKLLYWITFGRVKPDYEKRAELIRTNLEALDEHQDQAVEALKSNLEQSQTPRKHSQT